jgi:nucleoside-diphosphate-sugar epimerase
MATFEKVAVTGGSGNLGSYVVDELKRSCGITVLDLKPPRDALVSFEEVDILDLARVSTVLRGHDAVIHLGAINQPVPEPMEVFFRTNVVGTWNVLTAAESAGVRRCIVCSSDAPLGGEILWGEPALHYLPVDESHPLYTTSTYALTKQIAETLGRHFAQRGSMTVICLRPSLIAFPDMYERIVAEVEMEAKATEAGQLPHYERDTPGHEPVGSTRSYVLPEDVARAFRLALEVEDCDAFDSFFIAAADTFEPLPTMDYVRRRYDALPEIRKPSLYELNLRAGLLDISRARERLGWSPTGDWPSALQSVDPALAARFARLRV